MTAIENYRILVESHFGSGTATFSPALLSNEITGALERTDQFIKFQEGFHARLGRLASSYPVGNPHRPALLEAVNNVARPRNWQGAYAELVAIDFFNSDRDWLEDPIELNRDVPATETIASAKGMSGANFDGYYPGFGVSFDVKVLQDKIGQILENIVKGAKKLISEPELAVQPEFPLDMDFRDFDAKHKDLIKELAKGLKGKAAEGHVNSSIIPGLSFRYRRTGGSLMGVSAYDPYQHALNNHRLLFQHAKKFSRNSPSMIVFVVFPWFSESILGVFDIGPVFYRAFSRRCFCQYASDENPAGNVVEDLDDSVTMAEVTKSLSGVIFIEDRSVLEGDAPDSSVKAFAYLNPNANHKPSRHYRHHLEALRIPIDDFEFDNY